MKKIVFTFLAFIFLISLLIAFFIKKQNIKEPNEPIYIAQCMQILDNKSTITKNRDANIFQIKENENIIDCQALLWRIPVKFQPKAKSLGANHNPDVTQGVSILGAFSNTGQLLSISKENKNESKDFEFYNKIELNSLSTSFEDILDFRLHLATSNASPNRAKKIESKIKNLEVYDSIELDGKEPDARHVVFVPIKKLTLKINLDF
jgi:hypothetical protein